jgi:hypothetical protein
MIEDAQKRCQNGARHPALATNILTRNDQVCQK